MQGWLATRAFSKWDGTSRFAPSASPRARVRSGRYRPTCDGTLRARRSSLSAASGSPGSPILVGTPVRPSFLSATREMRARSAPAFIKRLAPSRSAGFRYVLFGQRCRPLELTRRDVDLFNVIMTTTRPRLVGLANGDHGADKTDTECSGQYYGQYDRPIRAWRDAPPFGPAFRVSADHEHQAKNHRQQQPQPHGPSPRDTEFVETDGLPTGCLASNINAGVSPLWRIASAWAHCVSEKQGAPSRCNYSRMWRHAYRA
jgi:hypothetical protein